MVWWVNLGRSTWRGARFSLGFSTCTQHARGVPGVVGELDASLYTLEVSQGEPFEVLQGEPLKFCRESLQGQLMHDAFGDAPHLHQQFE